MTEAKCGRCKHWLQGRQITTTKGVFVGYAGDCRRHAPIAATNQHGASLTRWPHTNDADCCGDFEEAALWKGQSCGKTETEPMVVNPIREPE